MREDRKKQAVAMHFKSAHHRSNETSASTPDYDNSGERREGSVVSVGQGPTGLAKVPLVSDRHLRNTLDMLRKSNDLGYL